MPKYTGFKSNAVLLIYPKDIQTSLFDDSKRSFVTIE